MMKKVIPLLLFLLLSGTAGWAQYDPLTVPDLPNLEVRRVERARQDSLRMGNLPPVERRAVTPPERAPLQIAQFPEVQHRRVVAPEVSGFIGPQLPRVELLSIKEFKDFKGGLNLSSYKTKVAPNQAVVLENALWNEQGEMYKRPGYDTLKTTPEVFNFLYRYYQQDGDKYLMGGSDTALYFWEADSSAWTYLIGTEGTSGRWDGTTFEDMFVGTHEGINPVVWDGTGFIEMGASTDSLQVIGQKQVTGDSTGLVCAVVDSFQLKFDPTLTGWVTNEWEEYVLGYWAFYYTGPPGNGTDTVFAKSIIRANTNSDITLYGFKDASFVLVNSGGNYYAKIYSWFGIDSVWREGKADSVGRCQFTENPYSHGTKIWDVSFDWDSTFAYKDYIFEVISGEGEGKKCFLRNHCRDLDCDDGGWDTSGFVVPAYHHSCFDTNTSYRIYLPSFTGRGAKFTESFDEGLWIGWTGTDADQNKNEIIYSEPSDLGNWPPENQIYLPEDGDYITGMKSLSDARHVDVPSHLLMVTQNASSYKIVPTSTAGLYDSWYISTRVGCVSNSAMSVGEGLVLFPDQNGVWAWDQRGKPQCISLLIDPIFEDLVLENLEDMSAIYNPQDRHYYLSYPDTSLIQDDTTTYCIVTFEDDRDGYWGCYAQRFNYEMTKLDTNFRVDDDETATDQEDPNVTIDGQGRWIFAWGDQRYGDPYYDVRFRRFGNDGTALDTSIQVNEDVEYSQWMPDISANVDGKFVVVWEDRRNAQYTPDIYAQRFDSAGDPIGSNFLVDSCTPGCYDPQVEIAADGKFVISWFVDATTVFHEVFFQRYDSAGNTVGDNEGILDTEPYGVGSFIDMGMNQTNGSFVISWNRNEEQYGTYDVWAQRLDSAGTALGTNFKVNDDTTNYTQEQPCVAINSDGNFIISMDDWREYATDGFSDIWAQRYLSGGSKLKVNFGISFDESGEHKYNSCDIDSIGNSVTSWCVYWDVGDSIDINVIAYTWAAKPRCVVIRVNDAIADARSTERNEVCVNSYLPIVTPIYKTLAWNIDYHGWSEETFSASAYAYQHGLTDSVKILFADPEDTKVYNYGTQADDVDDAVILTYQSPYMSFTEYPYWENFLRYATIEAYLDTGTIYLDFYADYSTLVHQDSIVCGTDCREEIQLPDSLYGKNLSMKVTTGSTIETFYLPRYWWEYNLKKERD